MSYVRKHLSASEKAALADHGGWHGNGPINEEAVGRAFNKTLFQRYLNLVPERFQVPFGVATIIGVSSLVFFTFRPSRGRPPVRTMNDEWRKAQDEYADSISNPATRKNKPQ